MPDIATTDELRRRIAQAQAGVAALARREPENSWLTSIQRQLDYVDGAARDGAKRLDRADELNFGLLASHYVDDVDPALATELHAISDAARRLLGG
ncbi:immunity protein Tsi6 family protein [Azospirillum sp. A1-3]|uniref:immunity protein Tsi6 family protein n=1 Tax=Azospirillum sp. A1-3 TaxID=185874 RepID=UPI0020779AE6|nr:immunity protein Tsi6 family protein [Azospirillum sp. A1-3]MCM8733834.1 immunity protein Tsi6 family protein [Azospirillum sp. A1-3]